MVGGVCGGLAEYSGIDPLLWRVGFVALAFAGGTGVIIYLLLWLLMPSGDRGSSPAAAPFEKVRRRERRALEPRSPVPRVTIAGLLIVTGVLVMISRLGGWAIAPRDFFGAALLVVGLGLVAAAFTSGRRARGGLIALGIVLSLAATASTASWHWHGGTAIGDRVFQPADASQVLPTYDGGVGDMTVDLTRVDLRTVAKPIPTRIEHGIGNVVVLVPESADVQVTVDNGLGNVQLFDGQGASNGLYEGIGSQPWAHDGQPEFQLTISSGIGDVEVSRG